jgi:hypothetical protein
METAKVHRVMDLGKELHRARRQPAFKAGKISFDNITSVPAKQPKDEKD